MLHAKLYPLSHLVVITEVDIIFFPIYRWRNWSTDVEPSWPSAGTWPSQTWDPLILTLGFPDGSVEKKKIHLPMQDTKDTWVQSLGQEDALKQEMATCSISCLGNPHGQRSTVGCSPWGHRVGHDWATWAHVHTHMCEPREASLPTTFHFSLSRV